MNLPLSFILTLLISLTTGTTTLASEHWTRRESSNRPTKAPGSAKFYNNTDLNRMEVHCQHGEKQCELNALHACVLEKLEVQSALQLINCMLRSYGNVNDECSRHLKLNVTAVKKCKNSRSTAEILTPYGKEALAIELSVVPSIVFDNHFEPYQRSKIPYNFEIKFPTCDRLMCAL